MLNRNIFILNSTFRNSSKTLSFTRITNTQVTQIHHVKFSVKKDVQNFKIKHWSFMCFQRIQISESNNTKVIFSHILLLSCANNFIILCIIHILTTKHKHLDCLYISSLLALRSITWCSQNQSTRL